MKKNFIDNIDIAILDLLQQNAEITIQAISAAVNLSTTPCWKRINKLKEMGYIRKTVALLNYKKIQCNVVAFVFITVDSHDEEKLKIFAQAVVDMKEVIECHRMSGNIDYLLKILIKDIESYDKFYKTLIKKVQFLKVTSNFAIENIKHTTQAPINL